MLGMDRKQAISAYCAIREALLNNQRKMIGFDYKTRHCAIDNFEREIAEFDNGEMFRLEKYREINHALESLDVYSSFAIGSYEYYCSNDCAVFSNKNCFDVDCLGTLGALSQSSLSQYSSSVVDNNFPGCFSGVQTLEIPGENLFFKMKHDSRISAAGGTELKFVDRMLSKISSGLLLDESANVELIFQKLNVYSEFMPFSPSPDSSTHDPSTFVGTVLVCLPSEHTGGDVTVCHGQDQFLYSFTNKSTKTDRIQFVAFFGDCEFDIAPIISGHSVILTYSIICHSGKKIYSHMDSSEKMNFTRSLPRLEEDRFENKLNKIFLTATNTMADQCFGVFLSGDYISRGLAPENLTEHDKIMYEYMASKNIPVSLEPVLLCLNYYEVVGTIEDVHSDDVMDYEFPVSDFSVRLISGFEEDTRHEAHKNIPYEKLPIFNAWGKFTENMVDNTDIIQCVPPMYAREDVEPAIVQHSSLDLCYVMLLGPFPAADVSDLSQKESSEESGKYEK